MTKRQKANCQKLHDFIKNLPPRAFNIHTIISKLDEKGQTACGCVSGYLPTVFPRKFKVYRLMNCEWHTYPKTIAIPALRHSNDGASQIDEIERLLGLDRKQWDNIVEPVQYKTKKITKVQVLGRLRKHAGL